LAGVLQDNKSPYCIPSANSWGISPIEKINSSSLRKGEGAKGKEFTMNSDLKDVVSVVFEPALEVEEVSQSSVAVATNLTKLFGNRFTKAHESRIKLKNTFDEAKDDSKRQSLAKRLLAKDIELEILRNLHSLCSQGEIDLRAKLPVSVDIDIARVGDIKPLEYSQDS
jgi:hypothetical protein